MPSQFGGDQCGRDYAPHMWIGDDFIGGTEKRLDLGKWSYRVGRMSDEIIVAERQLSANDAWEGWEPVPEHQIPSEVHDLMSEDAFAKREKEVSELGEIFNKED